MKFWCIFATCLITGLGTARAGDLPAPVKAPSPPIYPTSGLYGGLGSTVEMSGSNVNAGGTQANFNSGGASISAVIGEQYKLPGFGFGFTEFAVDYTNMGGATTVSTAGGLVAATYANPLSLSLTTAVGCPWNFAFQYLPSFGALFGAPSPSLPAGLTPVSSVPYCSAAVDVQNLNGSVSGVGSSSTWQATPQLGVGLLNYLGSGYVIDTRMFYEFAGSSFAIGTGNAVQKGSTFGAKLIVKF